jgi:hypothetical protein
LRIPPRPSRLSRVTDISHLLLSLHSNEVPLTNIATAGTPRGMQLDGSNCAIPIFILPLGRCRKSAKRLFAPPVSLPAGFRSPPRLPPPAKHGMLALRRRMRGWARCMTMRSQRTRSLRRNRSAERVWVSCFASTFDPTRVCKELGALKHPACV